MIARNGVLLTDEVTEQHYEWVLSHFPGSQKRKSRFETNVICPCHPDSDPSLGVDVRYGDDGPRIVLKDRSGECAVEDILAAVGLGFQDLFFGQNGHHRRSDVAEDPGTDDADEETDEGPTGCTVEQYSLDKGLPIEFLHSDEVALEDCRWWGVDAVRIPYPDAEGNVIVSRYRVSRRGKPKVVSAKGDRIWPYGLHRLSEGREAGYTLITEGESDAHSAWSRGLPCLAIPGASGWKPEWWVFLEGIEHLLFQEEPDEGGASLWQALSATPQIKDRLTRVRFS
jgi:hypothetical protein